MNMQAHVFQVPLTWTNVKKKALVAKEKHSKEQNAEAEKIKRQSKVHVLVDQVCMYAKLYKHMWIHTQDFEFRVEEFFAAFKRIMPWEYSTNYDGAYDVMDRMHHGAKGEDNPIGSLIDIKADCMRLNEMQELLELFVVEYRQVKYTRAL